MADNDSLISPSLAEYAANTLFLPGDILLTKSRTRFGKFNSIYQRLWRWHTLKRWPDARAFVPTHAVLVLGPDDIIHSIMKRPTSFQSAKLTLQQFREAAKGIWTLGPGEALRSPSHRATLELARRFFGFGVERARLSTIFGQSQADDVILVRHPDLPAFGDHDFSIAMGRRAMHYLDMPYNPLVNLYRGDGRTTFCSQLIYQVFHECRLKLPDVHAQSVLPVDFHIWALENGWKVYDGQNVRFRLDELAKTALRDFDWPAIAVRQHKQWVEVKISSASLYETMARINQATAKTLKQVGLPRIKPSVSFAHGFPRFPLLALVVMDSAEKLANAFLGELSTRSTSEDSAEVRTEFTTWLLDEKEKKELEAQRKETDVPIGLATLEMATLTLDDLAESLPPAIEAIKQFVGRSSSADATSTFGESVPSSLDCLAFILDCTDDHADDAELEEWSKRLSQREDEVARINKENGAELEVLKQAVDAGMDKSDEVQNLYINYKRALHTLHTYNVAFDYIETCRFLSIIRGKDKKAWKLLFQTTEAKGLLAQLEILADALPAMRAITARIIDKGDKT